MNPATPTHRTAPTTVEAPAPTSTTPGNVIPFSPVPSLDSINGTNSYTPRPYASPRMLREEKRHLVDKLARYARTTKNPTARRYHSKIKGCGITPIGQGVTLVRHTSKGTITGGGVRNVARCKDRGCPVCAALTEGTRAKLLRAALLILHHTGALEGHRMIFATLTMGHKFKDDHARNWQVFRSVLADLKNQRWWRESIAGSYSQLEIEGTLTEPTKPMKEEAAKSGFYHGGNGKDYHRVQILTIAELLEHHKRPEFPDMTMGSISFKKAKPQKVKDGEMTPLF